MSFVKHHISLHDHVKQPVHKFRLCGKCDDMRPPEGGIELTQTKWVCAACWTRRATRQPKKK